MLEILLFCRTAESAGVNAILIPEQNSAINADAVKTSIECC